MLVSAALAVAAAGQTAEPASVVPRVREVVVAPPTTTPDELELGTVIRVRVDGLKAWTATHDPNKLVPYLNGRALRGDYPVEVHTMTDHVHFPLRILPGNQDVWVDLLGAPSALHRPVSFSVGLEDGTPFPSDLESGQRPALVVISPVYGLIALAVALVTVVAFVLLARGTDLIRDAGPAPGGGKQKPYNLGKAQMAFWFLLTYLSYLVIWLITDAIDVLPPSLLALMGISAGTALGEVVINATKADSTEVRRRDAEAERQALELSLTELQAQRTAPAPGTAVTADDAVARDSLNRQLLEQRTRARQLDAELKTLAVAPGANLSRGLWRDLLSSGGSYSIHRFQIAAWTVALGFVFVSRVWNNLAMPEFNVTLLGLMGISSGTYIGFKFPEKQ